MEKRERVRRDGRRKDGDRRQDEGQRRQQELPGKENDNKSANRPLPMVNKKKIDYTAIPDPHMFDNLKRETDEIAALTSKKSSKRQVFSNWAKYEKPLDPPEREDLGTDFETLLQGAQLGGHFQFKSERSWNTHDLTLQNEIFSVNLNNLQAGLACIPFYDKMNLPLDLFTSTNLERMDHHANLNTIAYNVTKKNPVKTKAKMGEPNKSLQNAENMLSIFESNDGIEENKSPAVELNFDIPEPEPETIEFGIPLLSSKDNVHKRFQRPSPEKNVTPPPESRDSPLKKNISYEEDRRLVLPENGPRKNRRSPEEVHVSHENQRPFENPPRKDRSAVLEESVSYEDHKPVEKLPHDDCRSRFEESQPSSDQMLELEENVSYEDHKPMKKLPRNDCRSQFDESLLLRDQMPVLDEDVPHNDGKSCDEESAPVRDEVKNKKSVAYKDTESCGSWTAEKYPEVPVVGNACQPEHTDKDVPVKKRRANRNRGGKGNKRKSWESQGEEGNFPSSTSRKNSAFTLEPETQQTPEPDVQAAKNVHKNHSPEPEILPVRSVHQKYSPEPETHSSRSVQKAYTAEPEIHPSRSVQKTYTPEPEIHPSRSVQKIYTPEPEIQPNRNVQKTYTPKSEMQLNRKVQKTYTPELEIQNKRKACKSYTSEPQPEPVKRVTEERTAEVESELCRNRKATPEADRAVSMEKERVGGREYTAVKIKENRTPRRPGQEDDQLDFLLSLKKPTNETPVTFAKPSKAVRSTIDDDDAQSKLPVVTLEKKSEDLEGWLDSMLDD